MTSNVSRLSIASGPLFGLLIAGASLLVQPVAACAGDGGDRAGETAIVTGPVRVQYDAATKAPIPLDALYILDYNSGRLLASLPTYRQSTQGTTIIESFVERDLAADFKIRPGSRVHFHMTTGSLGQYTAGWAALYVIETTTNQIGVYRLQSQGEPGSRGRPAFELLQMQAYAEPSAADIEDDNRGAAALSRTTIMATGPVLIRYDNATMAPIPLDALYLLDHRTGRLKASLPKITQSAESTTIVESFVARDLAADFKVDFNRGESPRFLMTTGSLGPHTAGCAVLYVIETTTNQLGIYRLHIQLTKGQTSRPRFELVQMRHYPGPSESKHQQGSTRSELSFPGSRR